MRIAIAGATGLVGRVRGSSFVLWFIIGATRSKTSSISSAPSGKASSSSKHSSSLSSRVTYPIWLPYKETTGIGAFAIASHSLPNVRMTDNGNRSELSTTGRPSS